jgi:hypothetical protein
MSYNHPLWAQQDLAAARRVLERLAPTAAARAAKAPAGKERDLVESLDVLFRRGDKLARDIAYAGVMGKLHAKYPADDEIACLYALALLGTGRPASATRATRCRPRRSRRRSSSATRNTRERRTTSSTRSTIPITPS